MRRVNDIERSELLFGDNRELLKEIPAYSCHLLLTDPPYLFTKANCTRMYKETSKRLLSNSPLFDYSNTTGECRIKDGYQREALYEWLDLVPRVMRKMDAYVFCSEAQLSMYSDWAGAHGYKFSVLVWEKPVRIIGKNMFSQNVEFIVRIYDSGTALNKFDDVEMYSRVIKSPILRKKYTPTQKPVEIFERLIALSTNEGDVVLDPFAGSATTAVASSRLGRKYICMECQEGFYKIARDRVRRECNLFGI